MSRGTLDEFLLGLTSAELHTILYDWQIWARDDQLPPEASPCGAPWTTWLNNLNEVLTAATLIIGLLLGLYRLWRIAQPRKETDKR